MQSFTLTLQKSVLQLQSCVLVILYFTVLNLFVVSNYNFYLISSESTSILISIPIKETIKTNTMIPLPQTVPQLLYFI